MNETSSEKKLVIHGEAGALTEVALVLAFLFCFLFAGTVLLALLLPGPTAVISVIWRGSLGWAGFLFLCGVIVLVEMLYSGTWHICSEGLEHRPRLGRPRFLRWHEVEKASWTSGSLCLKGHSVTVRIPWLFVSEEDVARATRMIEEFLATANPALIPPAKSRSALAVETPDGTLTITTEVKGWRLDFIGVPLLAPIIVFIFAGAVGVGLYASEGTIPVWGGIFLLILLVFGVASLVNALLWIRGTWEIRKEGLAYFPLYGKPRSLS